MFALALPACRRRPTHSTNPQTSSPLRTANPVADGHSVRMRSAAGYSLHRKFSLEGTFIRSGAAGTGPAVQNAHAPGGRRRGSVS